MIDYVRLSTDISIRKSTLMRGMWTEAVTTDGQPYCYHSCRGVWLRYYPAKERMTISGKILMLLHDTQVLNVDDIYGTDIDRFMDAVNAKINSLFTRPIIDVRTFRVSRIDYCFNVETPYVTEYVTFMNEAFRKTNKGVRVNYVQEMDVDGSVYVKTRSDYENNERRNYVLNFYDKADRLRYQKMNGQRVAEDDFECARDVLRLEAQCGFQFLRKLREKLHIGDTFGEMVDFKVAFQAIEAVYSRVFKGGESLDYCTYETAKKLAGKSEAAKKALYAAATHHDITQSKYAHGVKVIKKLGIYPFCFLRKDGGVERLDNSLKLIRNKIEKTGSLVD